ncbi:MAG: hypothetical protein KDB53_11980, partial [Planctomycetes bacterium]|nr:hypothetical protein [Planctomycetota bacterium]
LDPAASIQVRYEVANLRAGLQRDFLNDPTKALELYRLALVHLESLKDVFGLENYDAQKTFVEAQIKELEKRD